MKLTINYQKGYWRSLDGIRGVAILAVFFYHCYRFGPLKNIFKLGWAGVDLFFVLSGFLITGILYDSPKIKKHYYRNFIAKRALRIFPLYYLSIFLFFAGVIIFKSGIFNYSLHSFIYYFSYAENIYFSLKGWPRNNILNHLWSLAIEEQFYIIWPLVLFFFKGRQIIIVSIVGVLISILIRNFIPVIPFAYIFTLARMDALLIGCLIAILIRERKQLLEIITIPVLIVSTLSILLIIIYTRDTFFGNIYFIRAGYTLFDIIFGCSLVALFDTRRTGNIARKLLEARPLLFLGKYSYGIYVWHRILFVLLFAHIENYLETLKFISLATIPAISLVFFSIIVLLVSYTSYHFFEKRFLKMKKYFN